MEKVIVNIILALKCFMLIEFRLINIDVVGVIVRMLNVNYEIFMLWKQTFLFDGFNIYKCGKMVDDVLVTFTKMKLDCRSGILSVNSGWGNIFVRMVDGSTYCYGNNSYHQMGLSGNVNEFVKLPLNGIKVINGGSWHILAATNNGIFGCGHSMNGRFVLGGNVVRKFTKIDGIESVVSIACSDYNNAVITLFGTFLFGQQTGGKIVRVEKEHVKSIRCMFDYAILLGYDGHVYKANYRDFKLTKVTIVEKIVSMESCNCSITLMSELNNIYIVNYFSGNDVKSIKIQYMDDGVRAIELKDESFCNDDVDKVWHYDMSWFVRVRNSLYAAGYNDYGRLGVGHRDNLSVFGRVILPTC